MTDGEKGRYKGRQKAGSRKIVGGRKLEKSKVWMKGMEGRLNGLKASKKKRQLFFNVEGKVDRIEQTNGTKHRIHRGTIRSRQNVGDKRP
jgi:hypothetical protein